MAETEILHQHVIKSNLHEAATSSFSKETMPDILAGRFLSAISQGQVEDTAFKDPRTRLFAQLGIRDERIPEPLEEDIDMLIASLSHIDTQKRITVAYRIADLYETIKPNKQMHTRINLILMMWRDANRYARIAAVESLARIATKDVLEALLVTLRDEDKDVRAAAARALGRIGGNVPLVELISTARDVHWSVRASSIQAMGQLKQRIFLNAIVAALDDEDASVRMEAIHALVQLEAMQVVPRLILIARKDHQPLVRDTAIRALECLNASDATLPGERTDLACNNDDT